ncbi:MAG: YdcH family protein [Caulobacteraceae bacterium]
MDTRSQEDDPDAQLRVTLASLKQAHQDLDAAVHALEAQAAPNQLQIARLKKQKLALRDQIAQIDRRLTPDIIA